MLRSTLLTTILTCVVAAGPVFAGGGHHDHSRDGKMPYTTSSEEALHAFVEATSLLERVQVESARPLFEKAVELDPQFIMAWVGLARSQPRPKDRRAMMDKVIEMAKTAPMSEGERVYIDGMLAALAGDTDTWEKKQFELIKMFPNDERCLASVAGIHYSKQEFGEAVEIYAKAAEINPEFVPVYNSWGYALRFMNKNEEAKEVFEKQIEIDPSNPNAFDSYGELLLKMGDYEASIASYEHAIEIDPLFPSAHMGIASNLLHLSRYEEARDRLDKIYAIAPHDGIRGGVHWAMAVTWADQGNFEKALEELKHNYELSAKIEDKSSMSIDLYNMADVHLEQGNIDKAEKLMARSRQLRIENSRNARGVAINEAFANWDKCRVQTARGEFEAARKSIAAMVAADDTLQTSFMADSIHELRGRLALAEHDWDTAITELEAAGLTSADGMYCIAQAYEGRGDLEQARQMYTYVVEYRGNLNMSYSLVRHKAERKLSVL